MNPTRYSPALWEILINFNWVGSLSWGTDYHGGWVPQWVWFYLMIRLMGCVQVRSPDCQIWEPPELKSEEHVGFEVQTWAWSKPEQAPGLTRTRILFGFQSPCLSPTETPKKPNPGFIFDWVGSRGSSALAWSSSLLITGWELINACGAVVPYWGIFKVHT